MKKYLQISLMIIRNRPKQPPGAVLTLLLLQKRRRVDLHDVHINENKYNK